MFLSKRRLTSSRRLSKLIRVSEYITVSPKVVELPMLQTGTEASRGYHKDEACQSPKS